MSKLTLIILAYNEECSIKETLMDVSSVLIQYKDQIELLVVDDGSTDLTNQKIKEFLTESRSDITGVLKHPINLGIGASIFDGVKFSKSEYVMLIPGDNAYEISSIKDLINEVMKSEFNLDVFFGIRENKGPRTKTRAFYSYMVNKLVRIIGGVKDEFDVGGINIYRRKVLLENSSKLNRYGFVMETILNLFENGIEYKNMPVKLRTNRTPSQSSQIKTKLEIIYIITVHSLNKLLPTPTRFNRRRNN